MKKKTIFLGFLILLWSFLTIFFAIDSYRDNIIRGEESSLILEMYWKSAYWLPWSLLSPLIYYLLNRVPIQRKNWLASSSFHLFACLFLSLFKNSIYFFLTLPVRQYPPSITFIEKLAVELGYNYQNELFVYWCIIVSYYIIESYRKAREKDLLAYRLEAQLQRTQLQVLKMQLQPHFLFNTLNSISALIYKDAELADRMIIRLSKLLRAISDSTGEQTIPLRNEIDILNNYLEIEKIRFQNRLEINMTINPETLDALVPNLILQPLAENAIRHGVAPFSKVGKIDIRAEKKNNTLILQVSDNGPGIKKGHRAVEKGIGLSNTLERLQTLYKSNFKFELLDSPNGGLTVHIEIPHRVIDEKRPESIE